MQVNAAALQQIYIGVKTIFAKAFEGAKPKWEKVATEVPSSTAQESYKWLGKIPRLREWIGDRVVQNLAAHGYTIVNKDFELTIGIDRNDIEDDTIGIYNPLFAEMGNAAAQHPDDLVFPLLPAGFEQKCYDGKNFFAANHPTGKDGKTAKSNTSTYVLCAGSYDAARVEMQSIKGDDDQMLPVMPNLLVVPPQLETMARTLLEAEKLNDNTNPYKGTAEVMVVPALAGHPTKWYLLDTSRPIKPIIYQKRKAAKLVKMDAETDENVFNKKEFRYGVDCRDNAGYGLWQMAFGSTGAAAFPAE